MKEYYMISNSTENCLLKSRKHEAMKNAIFLPSPDSAPNLYRITRLPFFFCIMCSRSLNKLTPPLHFTQATLFKSSGLPMPKPVCVLALSHTSSVLALELLLRTMRAKTHPGTLKWKSQDMTNANTMQARRKLRNRWPCQNLRGSAAVAWAAAVLLDSFHCSMKSASLKPATLHAVEPQISQIL